MDKKDIKIDEVDSEVIEKEKFIDKIYNNKYCLITILILATIVLSIVIGSLFTVFFFKR